MKSDPPSAASAPAREIHLPLTEEIVRSLSAGTPVRLTGPVLTARDAAHRRIIETLDRGDLLPFDLHGETIYYVGPTPGGPEQPVGAAGPTTSSRMDRWTPRLLELGVRGMIGKGGRGPAVVEAMVRCGAVYFLAVGGAGALLGRCVEASEVVAWPDLGPEAVRRISLRGFPAWVAIDARGASMFPAGPQ